VQGDGQFPDRGEWYAGLAALELPWNLQLSRALWPKNLIPRMAGGDAMVAKSGETARRTGDFRCERCHERTHVTEGHRIPKCPKCGNVTFDTRENEPGNKPSS
jgi:hypothetical protein